jgi:hypothetical protein
MNRRLPAIASWLLQHLTRRTGNEALAGDLAEELAHGRSVAWYWRQVLWAILVTVLGTLRSASFALSFALLWSVVVALFWGRYFFPSEIQLILQRAPSWYAQFPWPWSTIFEISLFAALHTTYVVAGLSTYLLLSRQFSIPGFFRGTAISFILQVARMLALPLLTPGRSLSFVMLFAMLLLSMSVARGTDAARETSIVE